MGAIQQVLLAFGGASTPTDPYFANVVALLHMDGTNGSTTFTDVIGNTWTVNGNAQLSTAQPKFGTAAMLNDGNGDYITSPTNASFSFGSGDWTVEGWYRREAGLTNAFLADFRVAGGNSFMIWCSQGSNANKLCYSDQAAGGFVPGATDFPLNAYAHWAVTRSGSTVRGFMSGAVEFTTTDSRTLASPQGVYLGSSTSASQGANGYLDEVRITKGVARYTGAFTPPTAPFPNS